MKTYYELQLNIIDNIKSNIDFEISRNPSQKEDILEDYLENLQFKVEEQTDYEIETATIYNHRCFDIVKDLGFVNWEDEAEDWGKVPKSIHELAILALSSLMYGAFFTEDIDKAIITYINILKTTYNV